MAWLEDVLPEDEEVVIIEFKPPANILDDPSQMEVTCTETIRPFRFTRILDESLAVLMSTADIQNSCQTP